MELISSSPWRCERQTLTGLLQSEMIGVWLSNHVELLRYSKPRVPMSLSTGILEHDFVTL